MFLLLHIRVKLVIKCNFKIKKEESKEEKNLTISYTQHRAPSIPIPHLNKKERMGTWVEYNTGSKKQIKKISNKLKKLN